MANLGSGEVFGNTCSLALGDEPFARGMKHVPRTIQFQPSTQFCKALGDDQDRNVGEYL